MSRADVRTVPWLTFPEAAARAVAHAARAGAAARRPPDPAPRLPGLDRAAARRLLLAAPEGSWLPPEASRPSWLPTASPRGVPRARLAGARCRRRGGPGRARRPAAA